MRICQTITNSKAALFSCFLKNYWLGRRQNNTVYHFEAFIFYRYPWNVAQASKCQQAGPYMKPVLQTNNTNTPTVVSGVLRLDTLDCSLFMGVSTSYFIVCHRFGFSFWEEREGSPDFKLGNQATNYNYFCLLCQLTSSAAALSTTKKLCGKLIRCWEIL